MIYYDIGIFRKNWKKEIRNIGEFTFYILHFIASSVNELHKKY